MSTTRFEKILILLVFSSHVAISIEEVINAQVQHRGQPLALTADDAFLAVVNPDNNTVGFFDTRSDVNRKLAEVLQVEPNGSPSCRMA